jgi:16S rRNA (uracil1498-N3)-methyltransferase
MNIFYCAEAFAGETFVLNENESHHAIAVLRMKAGEPIHIFNGKGKLFSAIVFSTNKKEVSVKVKEMIAEKKPNYLLQIAIAPTKQIERMEWFVEKAVELGISKISPIICHRSERREVKKERLEKVALAACKQSKQLVLPEIEEAITFHQFVKSNLPPNKFIAWCETVHTALDKQNFIHPESVFLVGPEGDFTAAEVTAAKQANFVECSLGDSILRTETAGVLIAALKRGMQNI